MSDAPPPKFLEIIVDPNESQSFDAATFYRSFSILASRNSRILGPHGGWPANIQIASFLGNKTKFCLYAQAPLYKMHYFVFLALLALGFLTSSGTAYGESFCCVGSGAGANIILEDSKYVPLPNFSCAREPL